MKSTVQSLVHSKTPDSCFHRDPKHVYNERREENRKYRDREEDKHDAESFIYKKPGFATFSRINTAS